MSHVIAILVADLHLSHTAPVARSSEPSWYDAMARALGELNDLAKDHHTPVICAGDIFDCWNSPPEIINFAIKHLPKMYAIPGQHDLPHHRLEDIERSAYWTLVKAGVVSEIPPHRFTVIDQDKLVLCGFPWGIDVAKRAQKLSDREPLYIAVVHQYVWKLGSSYSDAPKGTHLSRFEKQLEGYDIAVFGDNHKGFIASTPNCTVFNCGTFMRRASDEIGYKPQVGLLYDDGTVKSHHLDTSQDKIEVIEKTAANNELDITDFMAELNELGGDVLDFETAIKRYVENYGVTKPVREVIQRVLEDTHGATSAVGKR